MIDYRAVMARFGIKPTGVIHIGAFLGDEDGDYVKLGFANRLFIEAQPSTFALLQEKLRGGGSHCENLAASDRNGRATFYVASNGQSSSLLKLEKHSQVYPNVVETESVEVETIRIDDLLAREPYREKTFNFINIDTQGAELMVLAGSSQTLKTTDLINAEINLDALYTGAPHVRDLDAFLSAFDFIRVDTVLAHATWGDAMYVKNRFTRAV